jgi:hypothetical protein
MPLFVYFVAAIFGIGALTAGLSHGSSASHFMCVRR